MYRKIFIGIIVVLLLWQCHSAESPLYQHLQLVNENAWSADSLLLFRFPVDNTIIPYDIVIHIKHRSFYLYRNLYLFITTVTPNGNSKTDTVNAILADSKGRWFGVQENDACSLTLLYKPHVLFSTSGIYQMKIRQAMRDTVLTGITSIGIEIRKSVLRK
jgi:gliding motility-associated lipoprotein GldH